MPLQSPAKINSKDHAADPDEDDFDLANVVQDSSGDASDEEILAALEEIPGLCETKLTDCEIGRGMNAATEFDTSPNFKSMQADKLAKPIRPVSLWRDAGFLRNLEAFLASQVRNAHGVTSVSCPTPFTPSTYPSLTKLTDPKQELGSRERRPKAAWWHVFLASPATNHRVPAEWRDTSDQLKVLYRHLALRTFGDVHSFTLNLRADIGLQARVQNNPVGWFHDRLVRYLEAELGRSPQFHFIAEEAEHHRLHFHGEIQCSSEEAVAVRGAFRLAGGEWAAVRQHQAHTEANPDQGWASYISKDLWKVRFTRDFLPRYGAPRSSYAVTFSGNAISTTRSLGREASDLYGKHRGLLMNARKAQ
jgi:hypothetical protein